MQQLRALVVDDEYAARETLCRLVDWSDFGFSPPVTATNGAQALEAWRRERFDLVLTDIEMPVMNGIELIEAIRREDPLQAIVVVSCHEKFAYARRALQLGVEDYFIKDLLTRKELTAFLSSLALQSGYLRPVRSPQRNTLDDALRLAAGGAPLQGADWPAPGFEAASVFAVMIDEFEALLPTGEEAVLERVSAFVAETECLARYYPGGDTCYFLFQVENNPSLLYYYTSAIGIAGGARLAAKKNGLRSVSIGVSNLFSGLEGMGAACRQAREAAQMRIVNGQGRTILFDTIALRKSALDFRQTDYLLKCIEDFSHHANTACLHLIDKLYEVALPSSFAHAHYFRYLNARLWALVQAVARAQGREYQAVLSSLGVSMESVNRMESSREMSQFFKTCLLALFAEDAENDNLVNRALRLIEREYTQDISLSYIADELHTNKSYLSRLFKEKTGDSVMNYIMGKKISRAKHLLLHTQMKLYEISDSLSFASPQYLSTVFKRYTGVSPNEYKRALLREGEER